MKITELLQVNEMKNEFGEVIYSSFGTWKRAAKTANPDVWFDGDADICNAMVGPKPYKRLQTRAIGEWDGEQGVVFKSAVNEQQDVVHFYIDSERAYDAIMKKFGYTIDQDEDSGLMTAPREHWAAIEQLAHDAGGSAEEEDYGLGSPEHYSVREQKAGTKFKSGDEVTIKNAKKYDSMAPAGDVPGVVDFVWPDGRVAVTVKVGASTGQMNVDASDLVQEGVVSNYAEQLAQQIFDLDPNMDTSGNAGKLLKYAYSVAEKELGADRAKGFFRDWDFLDDFVSAYHALQKQGVTEGLSKRDQQDVAAIKAAIERLQAQLQQPNADKAAIQASIAHEKKRLALYGQDMAEGSQALQFHVVSKLDGWVLASYSTRQEAEKNAHGNPVVVGDVETVGDHRFVRESQQSDYRVTNSWTDRGTTHKRWDLDHARGLAADRHQSTIVLWQERGQDPKYTASHRIEQGYWTNQSARQSPTKVMHQSQHASLDDAKAALKAYVDKFYGIKEGTGDPEEGWCLVSSDRPRIIIDGPHLDREAALEYKRSVPPAQSSGWLVLWGKEASDGSGEYVATRAVSPAEEVKEGFSEDDLAVGGTIIYKANDQYRMSDLVTKLAGRKLKLMNGATCDLADVVSTDESDWPRFRDMKVTSGIKYPTEKIAEAPLGPSYKQQFTKWGVVPKSKKMFVTFFKPGEEQQAKDFAEKTVGRLIKVDQAGREIKEAHELGLDPDKRVVIKGVRGMKSTPFSKKFKNLAAYEAWLDGEEAEDYEIYVVMNESSVQQEAAYADDLDPDKPITVKGFRGMQSKPFKKRFKNMEALEDWLEYDGDDVQSDSLEITNESTIQQEAFDTPEFASHHEEAMFHLGQANDASAAGDSDAYHMHMMAYHESMADHATDKGNSEAAERHAERASHHAGEAPAAVEPTKAEDVAPVKENKKELQLPILVSAAAKFTLMYNEANFILRSNGKRLAKMAAQSWQHMLDAVKNRTSATTEEGYSISLNGDSYAIADSAGNVLAQLTAADMDKLASDSNIFLDTLSAAQ